jgi:hypothetical protein
LIPDLGAVADGGHDPRGSVAHDQADVGHPDVSDRREPVEQNGLVGYRASYVRIREAGLSV